MKNWSFIIAKPLFLASLFTFVTIFFLCPKDLLAVEKRKFVLVLDAGHGGKDTGATSYGVREKDINLAVTQRIAQRIKTTFPEVKVIMTRDCDEFIPLKERARIANKNGADLFISIHTNSAKSTSANGTETYVLGLWRTEDNLRVAMRENQVIELEENYEVTYQGFDPNSVESYIQFEMMKDKNLDSSIDLARAVQKNLARLPLQNRDVRQAGFLVIREISMPGILIELGFVSNGSDRAFLNSDKGRDRLADAITSGFGEFYQRYKKGDSSSFKTLSKAPITQNIQQEKEEVTDKKLTKQTTNDLTKNEIIKTTKYRIQIASIPISAKKKSTKDSWFRGLEVSMQKEGNRYVYTIENTSSLSEARKLLKKYLMWYKDAYIAVYRNNKRVDSIHP